MFVTQPHLFLPSIIQEFQKFGEVSNFKVNRSKLEILSILLSKKALQQLSTSFPFKTGSTSSRYLGIHIPADASWLFSGKFTPLLLRTQADLTTYASKRLSWLGRVNALKMDVHPEFLYLFQTKPYLYTYLVFLEASSDVFQIQMESRTSQYTVYWTLMAHHKESSLSTDLTRQTIQLWLISSSTLSKLQGPMTPFFGTPTFPPAAHGPRFGLWNREDNRRLAQVPQADPSLGTDIPSRSAPRNPTT